MPDARNLSHLDTSVIREHYSRVNYYPTVEDRTSVALNVLDTVKGLCDEVDRLTKALTEIAQVGYSDLVPSFHRATARAALSIPQAEVWRADPKRPGCGVWMVDSVD